jgi:hypothetical protein
MSVKAEKFVANKKKKKIKMEKLIISMKNIFIGILN